MDVYDIFRHGSLCSNPKGCFFVLLPCTFLILTPSFPHALAKKQRPSIAHPLHMDWDSSCRDVVRQDYAGRTHKDELCLSCYNPCMHLGNIWVYPG
jgi:hypothetical protein